MIPGSVKTIGAHAFDYCGGIESVVFKTGVREIGSYAFANTKLVYASIPSGVTTIGERAFSGCGSMTRVSIPDSVTAIGAYAFANTELTAAVLPEGLQEISDGLFIQCYQLKKVTIPSTVKSIGANAFDNCALTEVELPDGLVSIGAYAFESTDISQIVIPDSVTTIGNGAFCYCYNLKDINLPLGLTRIANSLFVDCSLTSIDIPASVEYVGSNAFDGCDFTTLTLPAKVSYIGGNAFEGCYYLKSVTFLGELEFSGGNVYLGCPTFTDIYYAGSQQQWEEYGLSIMLTDDQLTSVTVHFGKEALALKQQPDKLVYARGEAFDASGLVLQYAGKDVTNSAVLSAFDAEKMGKQTILATYEGQSVCFDVYVFGFENASLTLEGKIDMNFYASFPDAGDLYEPGVLFFAQEPAQEDILKAAADGKAVDGERLQGDTVRFVYSDIAAKEMNDETWAVPVAQMKDGSYVCGKAARMSPAQYMSLAFDTYEDDALRTMLVDMLNYGAAAQTYFGYDEEMPANAQLSKEQLAYGTQTQPKLSMNKAFYADALTDDAVQLVGVSLTLENEVAMNVYAKASGEQPVYAELLMFDGYEAGKTYDVQTAVDYVKMELHGSSWLGSVENIPAKNMRKPYYVRVRLVYAGGREAYSAVLRYDVESYASTIVRGAYDAEMKMLADRMMRYGDSAAAYFGE